MLNLISFDLIETNALIMRILSYFPEKSGIGKFVRNFADRNNLEIVNLYGNYSWFVRLLHIFGILQAKFPDDEYILAAPLLSRMRNVDIYGCIAHDYFPIESRNFLKSWFYSWLYFPSSESDMFFCNSEHTRTKVLEMYSVPKNIVKVVRYDLGKNYQKGNKLKRFTILSVGSTDKRKNLMFQLAIIGDLQKYLDFNFVRVGGLQWYHRLYSFLRCINIEQKTNLSEKQLIREYQKAHIFIFPSIAEGHGLPADEAKACGCEVFVGNNTAMSELELPNKNKLELDRKEWVNALMSYYFRNFKS